MRNAFVGLFLIAIAAVVVAQDKQKKEAKPHPDLSGTWVLDKSKSVRGGKFDGNAAADLIPDLMVLPVDRWHMSPLLPRMWELRDNLTPYHAAYVALAEMTGAVLVTGDERITASPKACCDIQIIK